MASVIIGDYKYTTEDSYALAKVVDTSKNQYEPPLPSVTISGRAYPLKYLTDCFRGCVNLTESPTLPEGVLSMTGCFFGCSSLKKKPTIPSTVTTLANCFNGCMSLEEAPSMPPGIFSMNGVFKGCMSLTEVPSIPAGVTMMHGCFEGCSSLTEVPASFFPNGITAINECFRGCSSLTTAPVIPSGVTSMVSCFQDCTSLEDAPSIPSSVTLLGYCFDGCSSLSGNIEVYNTPDSVKRPSIFRGTKNNIFINDKGSGGNVWKSITSEFANVHYEADDNPIPVISNFTATRVSAVGSTTFDATGLYAYVQARLMVYDNLIPVGWTNELKSIVLKDNSAVESPTWQPTITDYPADVHCWIYLGDTSTHNLSLQITDSIKENNVEVKSQSSIEYTTTVSKSYALVDYYHDAVTDTEGMAIGKYAEQADLLDVDMPTMFRQGLSSDDDVSVNGDIAAVGNLQGENELLELDTTAQSGTDKEIYDALVALGWDSDVIV